MMADNTFKKYLGISFGVHFAIFLFLLFSPNFQRGINTNAKVKWVKLSYGDGGTNVKSNPKNLDHLPQSSLKDQKQALKDQTQAVEKTTSPSQKNEVGKKVATVTDSNKATAKDGGVNLKKAPVDTTDSTMDSALKRIASLQQQRKVEIGAAQTKDGDTGQSLQGGDEGSAEATELILYYNQVRQKISKEWVVIKSEFAGTLVSRIVVRIDVNGNIIDANTKQSSGDGSFDESAMRAVKKAMPFPIPPLALRSDLAQDGFEFVFNPKSVSGKAFWRINSWTSWQYNLYRIRWRLVSWDSKKLSN